MMPSFFCKGKDLTAPKELNGRILEDHPKCVTYLTKHHNFYTQSLIPDWIYK